MLVVAYLYVECYWDIQGVSKVTYHYINETHYDNNCISKGNNAYIYCCKIDLYNYKNSFYFKRGELSLYDVIIVHHGNINTWHLQYKSGGKINDLNVFMNIQDAFVLRANFFG